MRKSVQTRPFEGGTSKKPPETMVDCTDLLDLVILRCDFGRFVTIEWKTDCFILLTAAVRVLFLTFQVETDFPGALEVLLMAMDLSRSTALAQRNAALVLLNLCAGDDPKSRDVKLKFSRLHHHISWRNVNVLSLQIDREAEKNLRKAVSDLIVEVKAGLASDKV